MKLTGLKKNLQKCLDLITRKNLLSVHSKLSVTRQSELLDVSRTSVYYVPVEKDLEHENKVKERLDYWHTKMPYMGVRKLKIKLNDEDGIHAGRKLIKRCMAEMGIYAVYPKPNLSKRNQKHKIYPYLLRNLAIARPNQVWAVDITYIKMGRSHMYMTAVTDWYSRYIAGWALSDTLDTAPVLDAITSAIEKYGKPEIINSDQGSQFTSVEYTDYLKNNHIKQSMDGKARWVDNVIIERWFRSLKTEYIYTNELETPRNIVSSLSRQFSKNLNEPNYYIFNGFTYPLMIHANASTLPEREKRLMSPISPRIMAPLRYPMPGTVMMTESRDFMIDLISASTSDSCLSYYTNV